MKRLDLAIDSDLGNVSLLAVAVNRVCLQLGLDEMRAGQVELCVAEAATNAIYHAYHGAHGHPVSVTLKVDPGHLLIEVSDAGTPMALEQQQKLASNAQAFEIHDSDPRSLPEGGRGLHIIRELMDKVSYVSDNQFNRLIMTKRLARS